MLKRFFWAASNTVSVRFGDLCCRRYYSSCSPPPCRAQYDWDDDTIGRPGDFASADWEEMPEVMPLLRFTMLIGTLGSVWLAGRFLDRRKFVDSDFASPSDGGKTSLSVCFWVHS